MARRQSSLLQPRRDGAGELQSGDASGVVHGRTPDATDRGLARYRRAVALGMSRYRYLTAVGPTASHQDGPDRTGLRQRAGDMPAGLDGSE